MSLESAIISLTAAVEALTARLNHETGRPAAVSQSELHESVLSEVGPAVEVYLANRASTGLPPGKKIPLPAEEITPIVPIPSPQPADPQPHIDKALYTVEALKPRIFALRGPGRHWPDSETMTKDLIHPTGAPALVKATEEQRLAIHLKVCEIEKGMTA